MKLLAPLRAINCPPQEACKKTLSIFPDLRESGFVAARTEKTLRGCALAPGAQEFAGGGLGYGRWARRGSADDRHAQVVTGVAHNHVEHGVELGELIGGRRCFRACSTADACRGECSRGELCLTCEQLRGIQPHLIGLGHAERIADPLCGGPIVVLDLWNLGRVAALCATARATPKLTEAPT